MPKYRQGRINDSVMQEVSLILRDVKDPRVSDGLITVTGADVSADLKYAKIFFSVLNGDPKEIAKGLRSSAGFLRREIAQRMNLRITPELSFVYDESITYGAHISKLLSQAMPETPAEDEETADGDEENEEDESDE